MTCLLVAYSLNTIASIVFLSLFHHLSTIPYLNIDLYPILLPRASENTSPHGIFFPLSI